MYILGISCYYHDAAAALLHDGRVIAAASEERFTRSKHDPSFPFNAIRFCLERAGISVSDLDYVGFYDKPILKFQRILYSHLAHFPFSFVSFFKAMPLWLNQKLWIKETLKKEIGYSKDVLFAEHHISHAASCYLVSPFDDAVILTVDGVGEWATASWGVGEGNRIRILGEIHFPHSLGLLYSALTYYLGFKVNSSEYKVMGLSAYGKPSFLKEFSKLIRIMPDGSFCLDMDYFSYDWALRMTNRRFEKLFGGPRRKPGEEITERHMDIAKSLQLTTEEVMMRLAEHIRKRTGKRNLCLAGGVALNCVCNGRILRELPFDAIWVQPAAGDAGGAIGVASYIYNSILNEKRSWQMEHAYLGNDYTDEEIQRYLDSVHARYERISEREIVQRVATDISKGEIVGWFHGRMEFGPRALGSRSILADARDPDMKERLNRRVKFREEFRPYAPSILLDKLKDYFDIRQETPFMLFTGMVRSDRRRVVPSITHADGSARIQSVKRSDNPLFYDVIDEFGRITGVPLVLNTSFNVRGEPIVCTPEDAYRCFMRSGMDKLSIGSFYLRKEDQPPLEGLERDIFEPD